MRTDDLIDALASDTGHVSSPTVAVVGAAAASGALVALLFVASVGVRPDLVPAFGDPTVVFKFLFASVVAVAAASYVTRTARPEDRSTPLVFVLPLIAVPLLGVCLELAATPRVEWLARAHGIAPWRCLATILALSLPTTAAIFHAMRSGAPRRPALAGAAAGVWGGAVGAAVFALYCPNDSALFVAAWYVPAILILALLGAALGSRKLAW